MSNPVASPLVLAGLVVAVATGLLSSRWSSLLDAFSHQLSRYEQMGILLLLLAPLLPVALASTSAASKSRRRFAVQPTPPPHPYPLTQIAAATSDKERFLCLYPQLVEELCEWFEQHNEMTPEAIQWIRTMTDYTVPGGKLNRGTTVLAVYRALLGQSTLTPHECARASVLGWTIEFLQSFFLVADDIMDDSQTRRGQPCWYKNDHVKLVAINDSFLLESAVFYLLRRHFGDEPYYTELLELLLQTTQQTELGQLLDLTSQPQTGQVDLDRFTMQRYRLIVRYKTAFYSFYLPVALGMILAGHQDRETYKAAKDILLVMGEYFQVQDDYLDCFGDPAVIGKVGTDIQENKCSWLVVQALERCNEAQKNILRTNYGVWDDVKVGRVKALYQALNLPQIFRDYEEDSYQRIQKALDTIALPRDVFEILLNKIYKRSK